MADRAALLRRVIFTLAWALPVVAVIVYFTGGFAASAGPVRLSVRQPVRPLLIGLVCWIWYVRRYPASLRSADAAALEEWLARHAPRAALVLAVISGAVGVWFGSFTAAGSDAYGYVSQAHLWLAGDLRVHQPLVAQLDWPQRELVFSPLGYRPIDTTGTIVPTYPPGLPLLMAAFLWVFGQHGPYLVVPCMAALMIWLTFRLGVLATGSAANGLLAAAGLAAAPVFLVQSMLPMSDVPAAAGWTVVAVCLLSHRPLPAGIAAGAALLVRPNLVMLAAIPLATWARSRGALVRFALGMIPAAVVIGVVNQWLYGSAAEFGYGRPQDSFTVMAAAANLRNYAGWLLETQPVIALLALVPLAVRGAIPSSSSRRVLYGLILLTLLSYLFYGVFDHWLYLRFLLPAFPPLFVLAAAAVLWSLKRLPVDVRVIAGALACAAAVVSGLSTVRHENVVNLVAMERRYETVGRMVAARTPAGSAIITVQHSGSVRHYANRVTLRYDWLAPERFDAAVRDLEHKGFQPFLLLEDWEEVEFRRRFESQRLRAVLDADPVGLVAGPPAVRLYSLRSPE